MTTTETTQAPVRDPGEYILWRYISFYSGLLIALNRRFLPQPIKIRGVRLGALAWCFAFFGVFSVIYGIEQFKQLF